MLQFFIRIGKHSKNLLQYFRLIMILVRQQESTQSSIDFVLKRKITSFIITFYTYFSAILFTWKKKLLWIYLGLLYFFGLREPVSITELKSHKKRNGRKNVQRKSMLKWGLFVTFYEGQIACREWIGSLSLSLL